MIKIGLHLVVLKGGSKEHRQHYLSGLPRKRQMYPMLIAATLMINGCQNLLLPSQSVTPPTLYSLGQAEAVVVQQANIPARVGHAPVLIVSSPRAAAGFDSPRIIYVRQEHKLEYFAQNRWVAAPAVMLLPLLVNTLAHSSTFSAVVPAPTSVAGQRRLDTEVIRLQHDFTTAPSRVRFTLRAHLLDNVTRRVLAWREFDVVVASASEDPYGGVVAANQAVRTVLQELAIFCSTTEKQR